MYDWSYIKIIKEISQGIIFLEILFTKKDKWEENEAEGHMVFFINQYTDSNDIPVLNFPLNALQVIDLKKRRICIPREHSKQ